MSYCFNCGNKVLATDAYCGQCGTVLAAEPAGAKSDGGALKYGYLFTNVKALALKLNISVEDALFMLNGFVEGKKPAGVEYSLIDVSDYHPRNPANGKHIRLSLVEGWQTHQRLLMDRYHYDVNEKRKDVLYLFIIGGHDIIPMPSVTHYFDPDEKVIETDMPYSFLYGSHTQQMLEDGSIFLQSQMLFTGRLPLSEDATYQMLRDYLHRAVNISLSGLRFTQVYGQCDPHWKRVSTLVTQNLREHNLLPDHDFPYEGYLHQSLFTTPNVNIDNIGNFFDTHSSLYYFNLHGSNFPHQSGFIGQSTIDKTWHTGILPDQLAMADSDNVVITEACYGAKHIGLKTCESMLLSSLFNKTIVYLGSSRIAYGATDGLSDKPINMSNADVIAHVFIHALLCGYDAGMAFYQACKALLGNEDGDPLNLTTIVEFNVFGDPTIDLLGKQGRERISAKSISKQPYLTQSGKTGFKMKKIYDHKGEQSLLAMVRGAVNNNIKQMREMIDAHLYTHYNIRPRQLEVVFDITYPGGTTHSMYRYDDECGKVYVTTDDKKRITKVVTSKNSIR